MLINIIKCDKYYVKECQNSWSNYRGLKCVKLVADRNYTYTEARDVCQSLNSTLLSIDSETQNLYVTSLLGQLSPNTDHHYTNGLYIGLHRQLRNGSSVHEFEWTDDKDQPLVYTNWAKGEPSDWLEPLEPCVEMYSVKVSAGKWNDIQCTGRRYAICQQWLLLSNDTTSQAIDNYYTGASFQLCEHLDYVRYRNNCYKAYDDEHRQPGLDWTAANQQCKADHKNGSLLWFEDSYEYAFVKYWTQLQMKSIEFWIGLSANNNTDSVPYEWINDYPPYVRRWAPNEPQYQSHVHRQCVLQNRLTGLWRSDAYCDDRRAFVCKVSEPLAKQSNNTIYSLAVCPEFVNSSSGSSIPSTDTTAATNRWINLHRQSPYCYWFSDQLTMDWPEASKHCRQRRGGRLVSVHSRHESELLRPFVQRYDRELWIGLTLSPSNLSQWEDGRLVTGFSNWAPGEPNNPKLDRCVELRAQDMMWNNVQCESKLSAFVCQTDKQFPDGTVGVGGRWPSSGADRWIPFNGWRNDPEVTDNDTDDGQTIGLSASLIWLLVILCALSIASALFVAYNFWSQSLKSWTGQYCQCWKWFNRYRQHSYDTTSTVGTGGSGQTSVRSSVRSGSVRNSAVITDRNVFDVRNEES
ncbi:lymphocyte antigen 75-like [Oppia nitens]|uniref:lymphocyte antigen 75-like n=1 Tax=Oppia nitens TaxID=1686743 RepID=UPI0023D9800F|nr:lymphocyte antigen 75-like [Oppia nitens]